MSKKQEEIKVAREEVRARYAIEEQRCAKEGVKMRKAAFCEKICSEKGWSKSKVYSLLRE